MANPGIKISPTLYGIFLKVVNPTDTEMPADIDLKGITYSQLTGQATVLISDYITDENSMAEPHKVVPSTTSVSAVGTIFNYSFLAHSVTVMELDVPQATSIDQPAKDKHRCHVFPNPVNEIVNVNLPGNESHQVELLNANGQVLVQQQMTGSNTISTSHLQRGFYILRIVQPDTIFAYKIVKE